MKTIWLAVILLAVVLISSTAMYIYSTLIYNDLRDALESLYGAVEDGKWDDAEEKAEKMNALWDKADRSWTPVMDHQQVDRVDESITRIRQLIKVRDRDALIVEIAVARRLLKRLKDNETPDLQNLF